MVRNLGVIESARAVVDVLPLPPDRVLWLRQAARQRATRNSTRIEGNTLNSTEVGRAVLAVDRTQTEMQQEVRNYWRALEWIEEQIEGRRSMSEEFIRELQQQLLTRLLVRALDDPKAVTAFTPSDVVEWFGISATTARDWLDRWCDDGFVQPTKPGAQRIRSYLLTGT
ncbi:MAG: hypothetical protein KF833_21015 [Verrucomicrobiae bacterium]|nr:hypothetical protein [Verrucomicrobiae bacterium]